MGALALPVIYYREPPRSLEYSIILCISHPKSQSFSYTFLTLPCLTLPSSSPRQPSPSRPSSSLTSIILIYTYRPIHTYIVFIHEYFITLSHFFLLPQQKTKQKQKKRRILYLSYLFVTTHKLFLTYFILLFSSTHASSNDTLILNLSLIYESFPWMF